MSLRGKLIASVTVFATTLAFAWIARAIGNLFFLIAPLVIVIIAGLLTRQIYFNSENTTSTDHWQNSALAWWLFVGVMVACIVAGSSIL